MKQRPSLLKFISVLFFMLFIGQFVHAQNNVGIGTTTPVASALLELQSTSKGFLAPRMTNIEMQAISAPANGLLVYNTTDSCFYYNKVNSWVSLCNPTADTSIINTLVSNYITTHILNADTANISNLFAQFITTHIINADTAYVKNLFSNYIQTDSIRATIGNFDTLLIGGQTIDSIINNAINSNAWLLKGNVGTNPLVNFIGTKDNNDLVVRTNNTEKIRVTTTGNLGVGTNTPIEKLDVVGNVQFSGDLRPSSLPGTSGDLLVSQGAGSAPVWTSPTSLGIGVATNAWSLLGNAGTNSIVNFLGTTDAQDLIIKANNTTAIAAYITGNMGFGAGHSFLAGEKFAFDGWGIFRNRLDIYSLNVPGDQSSLVITRGFGAGGSITLGVAGVPFAWTPSSAVGDAVLAHNNDFIFNTGSDQSLRIKGTTKNVLIGPTGTIDDGVSKLQVAGNTMTTNFQMTTGATNTYIMQSDAAGNGSWVDPASLVNPLVNNTAWALLGNAGTIDGTNFIGTTDNIPFNIRVNNQKAGRIDQSLGNTAFGYLASNTGPSGVYNTSFGSSALFSTTTGYHNTAIGADAMHDNTTGWQNTSIGYQSMYLAGPSTRYNVAIGYTALYSINGAKENTAIGMQSLFNNTTGNSNTGIGLNALYSNTTGDQNTAVGRISSSANTIGNYNVSVGATSLGNNTTGSNNTAIGFGSMLNNNNASNNTAVGFNTGLTNATGSNNLFIGSLADVTLDGLTNATAIGYNSKVGASSSLILGGAGVDAVYVGIGTPTPNRLLEVYGSNAFVRLNQPGTGGFQGLEFLENNVVKTQFMDNFTDGKLYLAHNGVNTMVVNSLGWAAFGNHIWPEGKVHVNGDIILTGATNNASSRPPVASPWSAGTQSWLNGEIHSISAAGPWADDGFLRLSAGGGTAAIQKTFIDLTGYSTIPDMQNNIVFGTQGVEQIRIDANGNMGIGTSGPTEKLEVVGKTKTTNFQMTNGATNGYVLQSDASGNGSWVNASSIANAWSLTGNSSTVDGTNFIGTTDNVPFNIRVNNQASGRIDNTLHNVFYGYSSGASTTTGSLNTAFGHLALSTNSTNTENTAFGEMALRDNTGNGNTALGRVALASNTTGDLNTAVGLYSMLVNTTGFSNTSIGTQTLVSNTIGNYNTAAGRGALQFNDVGNENAGFGLQALFSQTSGANNTGVGSYAGKFNVTGSFNTLVGSFADLTINNLNNATAIGYNTKVDADNKIVVGNNSVTWIGGPVAWSVSSDGRIKDNVKEDVKGLDFILKLRPVTYTYNVSKNNAIRGIKDEKEWRGKRDIEKIRFSGFIAQEVETAAKTANYDFSGVNKPDSDKGIYSLKYSEFVVPMVKAMQEQQKIIEEQQKVIDQQKAINAEVEKKYNALMKRIEQLETKK